MISYTPMEAALQQAIDSVPPGRWAIGVSGGADSVALLRLMSQRADIALHVVHLNHQTRGEASDGDAAFVESLAETLRLPFTGARIDDIRLSPGSIPGNPSARYRLMRQTLFRSVVRDHALAGVLLAHHADDQAETILQRLLRGSGWMGLCGMSRTTGVGDLTIVRPLLDVRCLVLREFLTSLNQTWREDASNATDTYQRNRLRRFLKSRPEVTENLLAIGERARQLRAWVGQNAQSPGDPFSAERLSDQPLILARHAAASWLHRAGVPRAELLPAVVDRLIALAADAAVPSPVEFPGGIRVHRKRGRISALSPAAVERPQVDEAFPSRG